MYTQSPVINLYFIKERKLAVVLQFISDQLKLPIMMNKQHEAVHVSTTMHFMFAARLPCLAFYQNLKRFLKEIYQM